MRLRPQSPPRRARFAGLLGVATLVGAIAPWSTGLDGAGVRPARPSAAEAAARPLAARRGLTPVARSRGGAAAGDRVIAPPPAIFDGPPAPSRPRPAALRDTGSSLIVPAGGVWAMIVGIDDYPGTRSDLRSAVADARDVDAALARYGVPGNRRVLVTDGQAGAATIAAGLDWLVAHASVDATVVFFYAGHVRKVGDDSEAIVGADGRLVGDDEVAERLAGLQARRAWIGIAACYGGGFAEALGPGRILTAAADADSLAYENATYGRSYLVEYMVRRAMIEGAADDSVEQSFAWATDNLRRDHPDRVPFQIDDADGDLVLGVPGPPPAAPPADPPAREPPPANAPGEDPEPAGDPCVVRLGSLVTCPDD